MEIYEIDTGHLEAKKGATIIKMVSLQDFEKYKAVLRDKIVKLMKEQDFNEYLMRKWLKELGLEEENEK